jgi:hypothetical protein
VKRYGALTSVENRRAFVALAVSCSSSNHQIESRSASLKVFTNCHRHRLSTARAARCNPTAPLCSTFSTLRPVVRDRTAPRNCHCCPSCGGRSSSLAHCRRRRVDRLRSDAGPSGGCQSSADADLALQPRMSSTCVDTQSCDYGAHRSTLRDFAHVSLCAQGRSPN